MADSRYGKTRLALALAAAASIFGGAAALQAYGPGGAPPADAIATVAVAPPAVLASLDTAAVAQPAASMAVSASTPAAAAPTATAVAAVSASARVSRGS